MKYVFRPENIELFNKLMADPNRHPLMTDLVAKVFANRGVDKISDSIEDLPNWYLLKGMQEAVDILMPYIKNRLSDRITILADYDADGATSCAVLYKAFEALGLNVHFVVPDRATEGYGLTPAVVTRAFSDPSERPAVLVTVDNGISAIEGVKAAKALGMKVVVTDHHLAGAVLPDADAIINPNQPGCTYPSKSLAGCGVAYMLACALFEKAIALDEEAQENRKIARLRLNQLAADDKIDQHEFRIEVQRIYSQFPLISENSSKDFKQWMVDLTAYVAIGTVADVVNVDDDVNRTLVQTGLSRIRNEHSFWGIEYLFIASKKTPREAASSEIGFGVGPRINAAGRLDSMTRGIECLIQNSCTEARRIAENLHQLNRERKNIEHQIMLSAGLDAQEFIAEHAGSAIVLHRPEWHAGVIGIVAGRLKEKYGCPVFVIGEQGADGYAKASGRGIPGFHLKHALDEIAVKHPALIAKYGGHAMAAGLSILPENIPQFTSLFNEYAKKHITPEMLQQELKIDSVLDIEDMTLENAIALKRIGWGAQFEEPTFLQEFDVKYALPTRDGRTLELTLERDGQSVTGIKHRHDGSLPRGKYQIAFKLDVDHYRNHKNLILLVQDMTPITA